MKSAIMFLTTLFKWVGAASIAGMMFLSCADIIMRAAGKPILGAVESVGFMATIALACSLPYTHIMRGHVGVDMVVRKLPDRAQGLVDLVTSIISVILFTIVAWQCFLYANTLKASGEVSMTLEFPAYVFVHFIGLAFVVLCLAILIDVCNAARKVAGK
jgi:TRAP-type transport system small permease protein